MFLTIWLFERYVLGRFSDPKKRRALISEDRGGAGYSTACAWPPKGHSPGSGAADGNLGAGARSISVIEQSAYARVAAAHGSFSVLHETDRVRFLDLDRAERAALAQALFGDRETERALHRANLADGQQNPSLRSRTGHDQRPRAARGPCAKSSAKGDAAPAPGLAVEGDDPAPGRLGGDGSRRGPDDGNSTRRVAGVGFEICQDDDDRGGARSGRRPAPGRSRFPPPSGQSRSRRLRPASCAGRMRAARTSVFEDDEMHLRPVRARRCPRLRPRTGRAGGGAPKPDASKQHRDARLWPEPSRGRQEARGRRARRARGGVHGQPPPARAAGGGRKACGGGRGGERGGGERPPGGGGGAGGGAEAAGRRAGAGPRPGARGGRARGAGARRAEAGGGFGWGAPRRARRGGGGAGRARRRARGAAGAGGGAARPPPPPRVVRGGWHQPPPPTPPGHPPRCRTPPREVRVKDDARARQDVARKEPPSR